MPLLIPVVVYWLSEGINQWSALTLTAAPPWVHGLWSCRFLYSQFLGLNHKPDCKPALRISEGDVFEPSTDLLCISGLRLISDTLHFQSLNENTLTEPTEQLRFTVYQSTQTFEQQSGERDQWNTINSMWLRALVARWHHPVALYQIQHFFIVIQNIITCCVFYLNTFYFDKILFFP